MSSNGSEHREYVLLADARTAEAGQNSSSRRAERGARAFTTSQSYNLAGSVTGKTHPSIRTLGYQYDAPTGISSLHTPETEPHELMRPAYSTTRRGRDDPRAVWDDQGALSQRPLQLAGRCLMYGSGPTAVV
ncbi:MAG: hypothetical protein KIT57_07500 [Blastocatellales bacterium]|nr:hypothetical protein [Blastocatellales bacterium]